LKIKDKIPRSSPKFSADPLLKTANLNSNFPENFLKSQAEQQKTRNLQDKSHQNQI
jgi:hypothetical protein